MNDITLVLIVRCDEAERLKAWSWLNDKVP